MFNGNMKLACLSGTVLLVVQCLSFADQVTGVQISWRNAKSKLKADLKARRLNLGVTNPGDDGTRRQIYMNIAFWPFANCDILILPLLEDSLYNVTVNDLKVRPPFVSIGEWSIVSRRSDVVQYTSFGGFEHSMAKITLSIRRSSTHYIFSIVVPLVLISLMTPIVFWIPPSSGERMSYLVSIFLSTTVYLSYLVGTIPRSMSKMPKLLIYLIVIMLQTHTSIIA